MIILQSLNSQYQNLIFPDRSQGYKIKVSIEKRKKFWLLQKLKIEFKISGETISWAT